MLGNTHTSILDWLAIDLFNSKKDCVTYERLSILTSLNLKLFHQHLDHIFITKNDDEFLSILSWISIAFKEKPLKAIIIDFERSTAIHIALDTGMIKTTIKRQVDRHTSYHSTTLSDTLCNETRKMSVFYILSDIYPDNPFCLLLLAQSLIKQVSGNNDFRIMYQDNLLSTCSIEHFEALQGYMDYSIRIDNIDELLYKVEAKKFIERYNKENERTEGNQNICEASL